MSTPRCLTCPPTPALPRPSAFSVGPTYTHLESGEPQKEVREGRQQDHVALPGVLPFEDASGQLLPDRSAMWPGWPALHSPSTSARESGDNSWPTRADNGAVGVPYTHMSARLADTSRRWRCRGPLHPRVCTAGRHEPAMALPGSPTPTHRRRAPSEEPPPRVSSSREALARVPHSGSVTGNEL